MFPWGGGSISNTKSPSWGFLRFIQRLQNSCTRFSVLLIRCLGLTLSKTTKLKFFNAIFAYWIWFQ